MGMTFPDTGKTIATLSAPQITRGAVPVFFATLTLAVLGDLLLPAGPWGLNAALWIAAFVVALVFLNNRIHAEWNRERVAVLVTVLLFGAMLAWRESLTLKALDLLALAVLLVGFVMLPAAAKLWRAYFANYFTSAVETLVATLFGAPGFLATDLPLPQLAAEIHSSTGRAQGFIRTANAIGIGFLISLPLVLVFGALFIAADAVFRSIVIDVFDIHWGDIIAHTFRFVLCAWLVTGYCRLAFLKMKIDWPNIQNDTKVFVIAPLSLSIPLALLDVLFGAFILVQARYLFGGDQVIAAYTKLTYAEYAREGYFQLVTVSALALIALMSVDWFGRENSLAGKRVCRAFSGVLVLLVYAVMASAIYRMQLYTEAYGLTELRVYTSAFMYWLAVVFLWFLLTVLLGKRERFMAGAIVSGFLFIVGLHVFNPDDHIVRTNLARTAGSKTFDATYASTLSPDAYPALIEALPSLTDAQKAPIEEQIQQWRSTEFDWRTWSWSRQRALTRTIQLPVEQTSAEQ
jgi:hypothetical protein